MATTNLMNRGFYYADAVFETIKIKHQKICFLEDHYFRLMASMRIMRMEIPVNFTLDFFEDKILNTLNEHGFSNARIKITVYRNGTGYYIPDSNLVNYHIDCTELLETDYQLNNATCEVEIFKDFFIPKSLLSNIKSTNKQIQVLAGIFAKENDYQNCLLLNTDKNLAETIYGNIFVVMNQQILTPPLSDGALNGIIRKQIMNAKSINNLFVIERSISSFDLQLAEEVFVTNVIKGVESITKFRKKEYIQTEVAEAVVKKLNELIV